MANLRGPIARGEKSGAFALGFSDKMKSVAGAMAVLALATTGTVVVQTQTAPVAYAQDAAEGAEAANSNGPIVADAIANGYIKSGTDMTNAKSTLSGRAFIDDGYGFTPTDAGQQPVPEGTEVFMQWIDTDGAVSPVYVAKTTNQLTGDRTSQAGPGAYAFDLREPWVDHHGKEHTYTASSKQYYKLWINPFVDERNGFTVYPFRQVGGFFPGAFRNSAGADQQGAWNTIGTNMQRTAVLMQADRDVPYMHKPKSEWVNDDTPTVKNQAVSSAMKGHVGGKVWHETKDARLNGPNDVGDVPASGMYVVMSVLTKEGVGAYAAAVDTLPEAQKLAAAKKLLQEHPEYIAATVRSEIGEDGYYSVKFPDGTLTNETKKYLYAHVETADGAIPSNYSAWRFPLFNSPKENSGRTPAPIAAENLVQNPMWYNVNFALVPRHNVSLDITNLDMVDNPAKPGDVAELDVKGPFPVTPNKIVWKKNGEIIEGATCEGIDSVAKANACTLTVPEDAKSGDVFTAEFVTGDDTSLAADSFIVRDTTQADTFEPAYEDKLVVPGEETKSSPTFTKAGKDENGEPIEEKVDAPEGSKFKITDGFTAPEGYTVTIDENNGEITVTVDGDKLNKDTKEEFDVPVTVTYPDESTDEVKANFKLDTDNDGKPDVTDDDDDGDGIPDEDDSNPKVPNANDHYEPEYKDGSGKPGSDVKIEAPTFKDAKGGDTKAPEGTKFTPGENAPDGVTIDENTGAITVTIPEDAKPGDKITVPVVVTYPDGTKDNVDVTVTVTEKDSGAYEPAYEDKLVVPGKETKSSPTFTDKEGKDVEAPADSKFAIPEDFNAPEGYTVTIDENSGEITVTVDGDKLNKDTVEEFDVPVTVTYPDGSADDAKAKFKLDTDNDGKPDTEDEDDDGDGVPDTEEIDKGTNPKDKGERPLTPIEPGNPTDAATFEPGYEDGSGKPGDDVTIPAPEFNDKDGNPTTAPEGTKFTPGENVPEGVTIDEKTGEITVAIPEDAKPGDKITVPVVVTYPDGTKDTVDVTVTVDEPDAKTADEIEPGYEDGSGKPGEDVTIDKPVFKDNNGEETTPPEGTKFEKGEGAPENVTVNEDGSITVPVPEDANPGDKITVPVDVTYPDGSKDTVDVTVTVEQPDGPVEPDVPAKVDYRPAYGDAVVVPAGGSKSAEITYDGPEAPEGTTYVLDPNYTVPNGWTIEVDEATGKVTATVVEAGPNGARQEELVVPVLVKYPESANATGDDVANATFLLDTDKDGTPDTTDEDDDGDGVTDEEEKENGSDPKDPDSKPEAPVNDFQPSYEEKTVPAGQSVTSDVIFTGEQKPEGTTFSIADNFVAPHGWSFEVDPETGTVTATVVPAGPDGARQEQVIVPIVVTYPDGTATSDDTANAVFNLDTDNDTIPDSTDDDDDGDGVTDEEEKDKGTDPKDPDSKPQPDAPAEKPDWNDDKGKPGDKVEIPNDGGPVQDGTTVETEGPGTAEIDDNGNLIVDIDKDAKPGDKVVVVVKDKDGNEIDRVVVEVEKPGAGGSTPGGSSDLPEGLIPGLIGGGIIGGIIGGHLGSSHGSSTPGHGAGSGQGADKAPADKGAGNQGGKGAGQSGASQSGAQSGGAQSGASSSSSSAGRQGSLAVTGVSGVAIMLGAAAMALAIGGALLAGRRRREN